MTNGHDHGTLEDMGWTSVSQHAAKEARYRRLGLTCLVVMALTAAVVLLLCGGAIAIGVTR